MNVITILCDTLRRDHCGPYHHGRPLNECWSQQAPDWIVPTPNMDRLAAQGTVFTNCFCGSTPCMPARRDIYTGKYEFLRRGWAPLEEEDLDLPRQISGPPNHSLQAAIANDYRVSYLVTDHFHLWEQGSGNYHMGYSGFDFIRGNEADAYYTDPVSFDCPSQDRLAKQERFWRNVKFTGREEKDHFTARVFANASDWLRRNHTHNDFYLHLDCFNPHEPLDPPEELLKMFDPKGYSIELPASWPYAPWQDRLTEEQFTNYRARYAAKVVLLDRWLGRLLDTLDDLNLWDNTMVVFTTDHATFNGDHGRVGKLQTHEFDAVGHIPFIMAHPTLAHGQTRDQLVQLVDLYPTTLAAVNRPIPADDIHGVDLLPVLADPSAHTRDYAVSGQFGWSVTFTDGRWTLHQSPCPDNQPLYWYSHYLSRFLPYDLGPVVDNRRQVLAALPFDTPTWLSDQSTDPNELTNLAQSHPDQLHRMQIALRQKLIDLNAPPEQLQRLQLHDINE